MQTLTPCFFFVFPCSFCSHVAAETGVIREISSFEGLNSIPPLHDHVKQEVEGLEVQLGLKNTKWVQKDHV